MRNYLFLLTSTAVAIASPCFAQDGEEPEVRAATDLSDSSTDDTAITVTATGTRGEVSDTGQAVTVIGEEEIEAVQGADLTRVLRRAPGVTISRNGPVGAFTGVRVRGAEAEQLLVVLDGVRIADPGSPGGGFDFGNLLAPNLAKLDLLRGSNSTIWGSDAIGGVLVASTRAESGLEAVAEYGARDSFTGGLSGGLAGERGFLGGAASYYRTDGFSAAASGTEPNGFEQYDVNAQGRVYFSDRFEIFARGRYAEGDLEIDGFPAPDFILADTGEIQQTRQYSGAAGAVYDSGLLFLSAAYSFADTERDNFDSAASAAPSFTSDGHSDRIELRGEWRPIGPLLLHFGGESEWTAYETLFSPREDTRITGAYVQAGIEFGGLAAHAGVRHDDHARFGGATSFGADVSYAIAPDLRLRASVGEGFKAPTLFQLFSDFGNEALAPEKSTSFDVGLAYRERSEPFYAAVTLFRRDSEDQIDFVSCFGSNGGICANRPFGTYDNTRRTRAQGAEIEAGASPTEGLQFRLAYALVDTENRSPGSFAFGNELARRPRHALTLSTDWATSFGPVLGADLRFASEAFDDAANSVKLQPYELLDLRASVPLGQSLTLFGRIENVFDKAYQTAAGFAQTPRGGFAGVRWEM